MTSPVLLDRAAHLEGLRASLVALVRSAERAGLKAPVPTTPDWDVRRLVAHQGMVHRWAAGIVRGEDVDVAGVEREGREAPDPLEWLRDGAIELVSAVSAAPDDLDALVFLAAAPPPRQFWARRQCHETTIHAVDALSAQLGRYPRAADAGWITAPVALDGIDELLAGFLPRPVSRLRADEPQRIVVRPEGSETAWVVDVSSAPPVTTTCAAGDAPEADVLLEGDPVALYLTLWNRSDEVAPTDGWDLWTDSAQVRWA
jgi:uncharacterized protein (TIGR03083 family)